MNKNLREQLELELHQLYKKKADISASPSHFSRSYIDEYSLKEALNDIDYIAKLSAENPLEISLYRPKTNAHSSIHLRLFQWRDPVPLYDILPMLENFNLRTACERAYKVHLKDKTEVYISDFSLNYPNDDCDIERTGSLFQEAFTAVSQKKAENDGLNKLILGASLSWKEVSVLRTYTKYLLQIGFRFSQPYIEKTLANNAAIASNLIVFFKALHSPENIEKLEAAITVEQKIIAQLESVTSLDEDKIIRRFLELVKATLRTNYFQRVDDKPKEYLAIKLDSAALSELPLPKPLYEIFVYSPCFEGIHLRKERIARGGIRWSDRPEDFRTEILGLMKAQVVKNTVIVPSGAKGGFVLKSIPPGLNREAVQQLVINCYQLFISALLDLTDNIKNGTPVRPLGVVCHDKLDPYLVVAADKGTASFSDIANNLAKKYDFWLGDAFASGGSQGYDHKKMAITARGAWESVKRHFRELDCNIEKEEITVIGIGDMSGDVFGNGMLYSRHLKLVGAFDHRHIFIDPSPNCEVSYNERQRLFNLPSSSWEDYSKNLLSPGGGIYNRNLKSIKINPQMQQLFAIKETVLTPNELISALLMAPVDLLFNGGIGTYVKSTQESQLDAGDRSNDYCRVNGNQLRCKVVAEGGNMGFTQRGRVQYSENGGLIYTDFIDNSAGVDCSDHEVNLKILLDNEVRKRQFDENARNTLLRSLTEEVAYLVLEDNRAQALVMSFSAFTAKKNIALHTAYIKYLEEEGVINREVEFLPTDKELAERKAAELGLTRPELAILLAYTKIYVKEAILKSDLPEDPYINQIVSTAFPESIRKNFQSAIQEHRLKREIVATALSNTVVNQMGITFVYRMQVETGATVDEIIRAFTIASNSFEISALLELIDSLDFKIPMSEQFDMFRIIRKLVNLSTRWFLHGHYQRQDLETTISHFGRNIKHIENLIPELMTGITKQYLEALIAKFTQIKLSKKIAERIASYRAIYTALNIIEVATAQHINIEKTARVYFAIGERMKLVWFRDELANDTREDYWHALTRLTLRDELDMLQRALTIAVIKVDENEMDATILIESWVAQNPRVVTRWDDFLSQLHSNATVEYTMFFIAIRELMALINIL